MKRTVKAPAQPAEIWTGGVAGPLTAIRRRVVALVPSIGEIAALVLFVAFVAFSIYWATLIF